MKEKLQIPEGYSAAVLHTHTDKSDGMVATWQLVEAVAKNHIRVLAITDHDTMGAIDEAFLAGRDFGVEIIAGEEIQTVPPIGLHIVGLFLKEEIPHSRSLGWTINEIRRQNGLVIIPHPLGRFFGLIPQPTVSLQKRDLCKLVTNISVDGIEIRHNGLNGKDSCWLDKFYWHHKDQLGARIGASDSHFGSKDLCPYITIFLGQTAKDLYQAIKSQTTKPMPGFKPQISPLDLLEQNYQSIFVLGDRRYRPQVLKFLKKLVGSS